MQIFSRREPLTPTREPAPVDREGELLGELHANAAEINALDREMKTFRKANFAFVIAGGNGRVMMRGADLKSAAAIRERWNRYLRSMAKLVERKTEILKEWSAAKVAHA